MEVIDGAPGRAIGVTGWSGLDEALVPAALVATTPTKYVVPLVSPVTVQARAVLVVQAVPAVVAPETEV